mmetsp:Transcript_1261/g.1131  ORF Transcript_1261/g.1131 Transcript_1261/m.1131 type:complete len:102 (-) Transcript_1261:2-307(-)
MAPSVRPKKRVGSQDMMIAAQLDEKAAEKALAHARRAHEAAREKYEARFSLVQRMFKHLGTETKAYREKHIAPLEQQLLKAQARWVEKTPLEYQIWQKSHM